MEVINLNNQKHLAQPTFAEDVYMGLRQEPKAISPKYFYDDEGSRIFQDITKHEDYYLTRTEFLNFIKFGKDISNHIDDEMIDIVELGVGDGHKTKVLISEFVDAKKKVQFFPIDISAEAIAQVEKTFEDALVENITGVVSEYISGVKHLSSHTQNRKLVLFLGSNIGNFNEQERIDFLKSLKKSLNPGDFLLIGFDLKKDIEILTKAYNDSDKHTEKFNLNILKRMNRELGANFNLSDFEHCGFYNPRIGAMESYVLPKRTHDVHIKALNESFQFKAFEPLHLEYSFKFNREDIKNLSMKTGFEIVENFVDERDYFMNSLWRCV